MTLVQLANFVRIAELQSLSKAAAVVRIAQPALSRQVRALELELGSRLLMRHARGVSLTPAGEALLLGARQILRETEAVRDAVQAMAAEPAGRVAIGVPTSMATSLLPALCASLRQKHPRLKLHFVDGFSAMLHGRTLSGELDLAVLYEDRAMGPLTATPLLTEALMLVGPGDAEVAPGPAAELLSGRDLILPARPNRLRLIVDEVLGVEPRSVSEVDSLPALIDIVRRGEGYTVLPYSTVAEDVRRGDVRAWPLRSPELSRTLLVGRPADRQTTAAVAAVEAEVRTLVAQLAPQMRWRPLTGE